MTEQHPPAPRCALTGSQATRIDFARRDLEAARAADLAQLPPAGLILQIERLRGRLDDILQIIDELTQPEAPRE